MLEEDTVTIVFSVNGKMRDSQELAKGLSQEALAEAALANEKIKRHLEGKEIVKKVIIPDKLVNLVVK
jgi:leucyl-tRNA synthetase